MNQKYANLKQEILSNKMFCISRNDWNQIFFQSQIFIQSKYCRDFIADLTEYEVDKYKIKDGSSIYYYIPIMAIHYINI